MLYLARRVLGYGAEEWRHLAWWTRQAYINGMLWEMDLGGWHAQRVIPAGGQGKGGGDAGSTFTAFESLEDRAAEGISTGVIYQDAP